MKEIDELKDEIHCLYAEKKELQKRIDKAIEYLENWEVNFYAYDTGEDKDNINELLDILKGSDKE